MGSRATSPLGPSRPLLAHLTDVGTEAGRGWRHPQPNPGGRCPIPKYRVAVPCPRSHSKWRQSLSTLRLCLCGCPAQGSGWVGAACCPLCSPQNNMGGGRVALSAPRPGTQRGMVSSWFPKEAVGGDRSWRGRGQERLPLEAVAMETGQEQKANYNRAGAATWLRCKLQPGL